MNKDRIGPLSKDMVLACAIHHLNKIGKEARVLEMVELLKGKITLPEISPLMMSLRDWGIVMTEHTTLKSGRSGRIYYISSGAATMIRETYELFWDKVME